MHHPDDILGKGKRVRSVARKGWRKHREFGGDKSHEYNIHICVSQNTQNVNNLISHSNGRFLSFTLSLLYSFFHLFLEILRQDRNTEKIIGHKKNKDPIPFKSGWRVSESRSFNTVNICLSSFSFPSYKPAIFQASQQKPH